MCNHRQIPIGPTGDFTHILVPANSYNFKEDNRLLIPFSVEERIGFVNKDAEVVIRPKYAMYYGDFIRESDYVIVAKFQLYGKARRDGSATVWKRPIYGLIDINGNETLKLEYYHISLPPFECLGGQKLFVVQNKENKWGIVNAHGYEYVPFGKYDKIESFVYKYAKVCKAGEWYKLYPNPFFSCIGNLYINSDYVEVKWPNEYERAKLVKFGPEEEFYDSSNYNGDYYDEFSGTYAHDVMGYDDDFINDAFDGDPDAYWNID